MSPQLCGESGLVDSFVLRDCHVLWDHYRYNTGMELTSTTRIRFNSMTNSPNSPSRHMKSQVRGIEFLSNLSSQNNGLYPTTTPTPAFIDLHNPKHMTAPFDAPSPTQPFTIQHSQFRAPTSYLIFGHGFRPSSIAIAHRYLSYR